MLLRGGSELDDNDPLHNPPSPTRYSPAAKQIMTEVCDKFGATLTEFNRETDNLHPLIHHPPTMQLSTLVNSLKSVSTRNLRQEFPDHTQNTCGATTSGQCPTSPPPQEQRPRHHRRIHHQPETTRAHERKRPHQTRSRNTESASSPP
ncbi:IS200/IS605 family transposase [Nocardia sp. NBC_00565]|uniref:IS200/IS605 family transposase n=1 Tax=Nocardia sp. NBC_00565 TaxID=2975993 RepID=UPI003FA5B2BB